MSVDGPYYPVNKPPYAAKPLYRFTSTIDDVKENIRKNYDLQTKRNDTQALEWRARLSKVAYKFFEKTTDVTSTYFIYQSINFIFDAFMGT